MDDQIDGALGNDIQGALHGADPIVRVTDDGDEQFRLRHGAFPYRRTLNFSTSRLRRSKAPCLCYAASGKLGTGIVSHPTRTVRYAPGTDAPASSRRMNHVRYRRIYRSS